MNILSFIFAIELGLVPVNTQINYVSLSSIKGYTEFEAGFLICDIVHIKGTAKTYIELNESTGYSFYPLQIDYSFDIGIQFNENIKLGFRHKCFHPIIIDELNTSFGHLDKSEEIYINISSKINIF